jgi:hypothetical protein
MLVLLVVETTDVIFAVDSIPAIFAITQDPFIVYTSNVFAILGLRALYFMLAGVMEMFTYLKVGLSVVLCFVGAKMMLVDIYKIPIGASLSVIGGVLLLSILASGAVQPKKAGVQSHKPVGAPRASASRTSGSVNPAVIGWIALFLVTAYLILATMGLHRRWLDERRIDHRNGLVESNPADAKWPHGRN